MLHAAAFHAAIDERIAIALAVVDAAHPAHAVIHDHAAGDLGGPLEIVAGAGADVAEDKLFRERASKSDLNAGDELAPSDDVAISLWALLHIAERAQATRNDRDLV